MFIELHILQNFAPSNLNRDDTGNPKDAEFGGVRRARISSQCIKRAVRLHPMFGQTTQVPTGKRTRYMTRLLIKALVDAGKDKETAQQVAEAFAAHYAKMDSKDSARSSVLIYLSQSEVDMMSQTLLDNWDTLLAEADLAKSKVLEDLAKAIFKATRGRTSAPDIALFGRMLAENPELNLDAACQVAHAFSTHRVNMDLDFFTAVDDLSSEEETGAGMMGVTGFNSATFYRYARIDWDQLVRNLDGDVELARRTVEAFIRASALAVPTGKQNAFAAQNPPDFILAVARQDGQAWSLANAFEKPVYPGKEGLMTRSIEALDSYWAHLQRAYGSDGMTLAALNLRPEATLSSLGDAQVENLDACVQTILHALPQE
jgi:CRISPR system Cascade subunit CasC